MVLMMTMKRCFDGAGGRICAHIADDVDNADAFDQAYDVYG